MTFIVFGSNQHYLDGAIADVQAVELRNLPKWAKKVSAYHRTWETSDDLLAKSA